MKGHLSIIYQRRMLPIVCRENKCVCVRERENIIHGMCALKLDACVNSAGGKVFMKTSIFQSLTRETVLCNKKTC